MGMIYGRIANPWMPNGVAGLTNAPTPMYAPGELGSAFYDQNTGNSYARLLLDSGATSAASLGVVASGQLAFWKDRSASLVTNDPNFNDTGTPANCVGRVAGIFQTAVTAAPGQNNSLGKPVQYYCDVLIQGRNVPVKAAANANAVPGAQVIANGVTGGVQSMASVTTAPTEPVLGVCRSSTVVGGFINVDVNIGTIA